MSDHSQGGDPLAQLGGKLFADTNQAAAVLDCDPRTVRAALARGEIPGTRVGQHWKVPVAWLRAAAAGRAA